MPAVLGYQRDDYDGIERAGSPVNHRIFSCASTAFVNATGLPPSRICDSHSRHSGYVRSVPRVDYLSPARPFRESSGRFSYEFFGLPVTLRLSC